MVWNPVTHITKQFKKPSVDDFPGTYEPLENSRRMSILGGGQVDDLYEKPSHDAASSPSGSDEKQLGGKDIEKGGSGPMTIERLRQELDQEVSAFGSGSVYDRTPLFSYVPRSPPCYVPDYNIGFKQLPSVYRPHDKRCAHYVQGNPRSSTWPSPILALESINGTFSSFAALAGSPTTSGCR